MPLFSVRRQHRLLVLITTVLIGIGSFSVAGATIGGGNTATSAAIGVTGAAIGGSAAEATASGSNSNTCPWGNIEAFPNFVGQSICDLVGSGSGANPTAPLWTMVGIIANLVIAMIVALGIIMVVVGGYIYMTAGGNASQVTKSKTYISMALLGIALALGSYVLLNTIGPQFVGK